jgi:DNA mismatch repair protein MutS2
MSGFSPHALRVLEYDRLREIVAAYALTALGREVASRLEPLAAEDEIQRCLEETEEMRALLRQARLPLGGVRDVVGELDEATGHGRPAEPVVLFHVVDLLRAAQTVRETLSRHASALPRLAALASGIQDLKDLREEIPLEIDPGGAVRDEASDKLAIARRAIAALRGSLRSRAQRLLGEPRLRAAFQSEGVTIKNDRYLLPVKAEYRSWVHGPIRDRSQSGSTLYIEPDELTLEGDRLLEELDRERDEVQRILWDLTRRVLAARPALRAIQDRLARVDFTIAKARYAEAFGLAAPVVGSGCALNLREARHPYLLWLGRDLRSDIAAIDLEAARARVVPIDLRLGESFRILVLTGPNTGGKTVVLKTAGLNVLLALSGVPIAAAEGSTVPLYGKVFADIGDEQSIEQSLSTFSSHLKNILEVLRDADERSLILLDELGSGTDPLEGAALGRALLDRFLARGWMAIITTHIGSLKELAYEREGVENAGMEFDPRSLRPTYRLLLGIPGSSNALAIARRIGLDPELIEAAEKEIAATADPRRDIIDSMERSRRRVEKERRRAERLRRRVQGEAKAYEERLREVDATEAAMMEEAQGVVDDAIRAARDKLLPLLDGLKSVPKGQQALVDDLRREVDLLLTSAPLGKIREEFARSLKKEDEVFVPKFRARGKVKKINKGDRVVTVLLNGILTEIGFDDVSWLDGTGRGG